MSEKESAEENLEPGVVLKMTESLQNNYCMVFYSFFNSSLRVVKLHEKGLYGISTAQKDRKGTPETPVDRKMKRGDFEYL